jgi:hypothetical protein
MFDGKMNNKNLEQQTNIKFCVKIGNMQEKTQKSPRLKKAHNSRSQVKIIFVCFFNHNRIVHYEFTAQGQTLNQQCYLEVLTRLQESDQRKRPRLWSDKWIIHHNIAQAHDVLRVRKFLAKNSITKMDHPPYLPELPPAIFGSFQN